MNYNSETCSVCNYEIVCEVELFGSCGCCSCSPHMESANV